MGEVLRTYWDSSTVELFTIYHKVFSPCTPDGLTLD